MHCTRVNPFYKDENEIIIIIKANVAIRYASSSGGGEKREETVACRE